MLLVDNEFKRILYPLTLPALLLQVDVITLSIFIMCRLLNARLCKSLIKLICLKTVRIWISRGNRLNYR